MAEGGGEYEDVDVSIQEMVILAKSRPSYSRMLSNAFTEADERPDNTRGQITQKTIASPSEINGPNNNNDICVGSTGDFDNKCSSSHEESESGDSIYLSAAEDLEETERFPSSKSNKDLVQRVEKIVLPEPRRGNSKKQKRKRKRRWRDEVTSTLPFASADTLETHLDFMLSKTDLDYTEEKFLPSLAALSLNAFVKSFSRDQRSLIPPGLQTAVSKGKRGIAMKSTVLSRLMNMATYWDQQVTKLKYDNAWRYWRRDCDVKDLEKQPHLRMSGSIWTCRYFQDSLPPYVEANLAEVSKSIIPEPVINGKPITENGTNIALGVLVGLLDALLPSTFIKDSNCDQEEESVVELSLFRVRRVLHECCPKLTEWLYAEALPYVWWARGNIIRAEKAFGDFIEHHARNDVQKATYLNELGRLYRHFGLYSKATHSFLAAGDLAGKENLVLLPLYKLQAAVLSAAAFDIGVMDRARKTSSMSAWQRVLAMEAGDQFNTVVQALVESVLCHHSGIVLDKNTGWETEVITFLSKISQQFPVVNLGLSFLYAVLGDNSRAYTCYKRYGMLEVGLHPWADVSRQGMQVKPMRIIWRQQLHHFSLHQPLNQSRNWRVGDCDHESTSLGLTPDGFLECDVHCLLPPISPLHLHPYTGSIVFQSEYNQTCYTTDWEGPCLENHSVHVEYCLYQNQCITVRLSQRQVFKPDTRAGMHHHCEVRMESPNGIITRLKLKQHVKEQFADVVRDQILNEAQTLSGSEKIKFIEKLNNDLQTFLKKDLCFDYKSLLTAGKSTNKKKSWAGKSNGFDVSMVDYRCVEGAVVVILSMANLENGYGSTCRILGSYNGDRLDILRYSHCTSHILVASGSCVYDSKGNEIDVARNRPGKRVIKDSTYSVQKKRVHLKLPPTADEVELMIPDCLNIDCLFALNNVLLILTERDDLRVCNTDSSCVPWIVTNNGPAISEDGLGLPVKDPGELKKLCSRQFEKGLSDVLGPVYRCIIACGSHVLVLEMSTYETVEEVHCLTYLKVPGAPLEANFTSNDGGFLVTTTVHQNTSALYYTEDLYQYSYQGQLLSYLGFMGKGPHALLPVFRRAPKDVRDKYPDVPFNDYGGYVYLRDGHGAIMCAQLSNGT